jgi:class 3 adenylate cyclase/streptogramin lyase
MTTLPTGTVTFLFSDVEGSTQLQRTLGSRYREVAETHRRLLEEAFGAHGGTVVDRQTESFFCVFRRARDGVAAAAAAQRTVALEAWPDGARVSVRMGIHAGEPEVAGDRYVGLAVSRAARICAAAHGGQVLLSSSARALLADDDRAALRSLGAHRLKDFPAPEPLYQLVVDGLPTSFPRPRTEGRRNRTKLSVFVGVAALLAVAIAATLVVLLRGPSTTALGAMSLGVVDPASNRLVGQADVGFRSSLIAAGAGAIWVADPSGGTVVRFDPATMARSSFGLGVGTIPTGLAAGDGAVWVGGISGDGRRLVVLELGPELGELRRQIVLDRRSSGSFDPAFNALVLTVGPTAVWTLELGLGRVSRIDPATGRVTAVADGLDASSIAVDRSAAWLGGRAGVTRIDPVTGSILAAVPISGVVDSQATAIETGLGDVWYTGSAQPGLVRISESANAVAGSTPVGRGPSGVTVGAGSMWVASSGDGTIARVGAAGASDRTIELGSPLGGVVFYRGRVWTCGGVPVT